MLEKLAKIYETAPKGYSAYHICDILLGAAERAGMMPPSKEGLVKIQELENGELCIPIWEWESEE